MNRSLPTAITLAILVSGSATALADPIVLIDQDRRIVVAVENSSPVRRSESAHANDDLAATVVHLVGPGSGFASAALMSSFGDQMHWSGAGTAIASFEDPASFEATSEFHTFFHVTSPVTYAFDGAFTAACTPPLQCGSQGPVSSGASLDFFTGRRDEDRDQIFERVFIFVDPHSPPGNYSSTGVLLPGEYVFSAFTRSLGAGGSVIPTGAVRGNFAFTFDLAAADSAPVPEPATTLLLGSGLAAVFQYRRSGRRR
jgi:hypothetical protein